MPLVGGHLLLPKVRLSRYIPASASAASATSAAPSVTAAAAAGSEGKRGLLLPMLKESR